MMNSQLFLKLFLLIIVSMASNNEFVFQEQEKEARISIAICNLERQNIDKNIVKICRDTLYDLFLNEKKFFNVNLTNETINNEEIRSNKSLIISWVKKMNVDYCISGIIKKEGRIVTRTIYVYDRAKVYKFENSYKQKSNEREFAYDMIKDVGRQIIDKILDNENLFIYKKVEKQSLNAAIDTTIESRENDNLQKKDTITAASKDSVVGREKIIKMKSKSARSTLEMYDLCREKIIEMKSIEDSLNSTQNQNEDNIANIDTAVIAIKNVKLNKENENILKMPIKVKPPKDSTTIHTTQTAKLDSITHSQKSDTAFSETEVMLNRNWKEFLDWSIAAIILVIILVGALISCAVFRGKEIKHFIESKYFKGDKELNKMTWGELKSKYGKNFKYKINDVDKKVKTTNDQSYLPREFCFIVDHINRIIQGEEHDSENNIGEIELGTNDSNNEYDFNSTIKISEELWYEKINKSLLWNLIMEWSVQSGKKVKILKEDSDRCFIISIHY